MVPRSFKNTMHRRVVGELTLCWGSKRNPTGFFNVRVNPVCEFCDGSAQSAEAQNLDGDAQMYEALRDEAQWVLPEVLTFQAHAPRRHVRDLVREIAFTSIIDARSLAMMGGGLPSWRTILTAGR
jgi:hypothetical protein